MAIITVTNQTGCGDIVCSDLARLTKYKLASSELIAYAAEFAEISLEVAKQFDEVFHSKFSSFMSDMIDFSIFSVGSVDKKANKKSAGNYSYASSPSASNYRSALEHVIRQLANDGNVIIVGRGSNIILKDYENAIHVKLIADEETRVHNVRLFNALSVQKAIQLVRNSDKNKREYLHDYYNADISDDTLYHLVINLSKTSESTVAKMIAKEISAPSLQA